MNTRWWIACAVIGCWAPPLAAQADSVLELGVFRLHKFKQPIGEERYRIVTLGDGVRLASTFAFTDRGTRVALQADLEYSPDLTPRHFDIKGSVSRHSTIDAAVDLDGSSAKIRSDSSVRDTVVAGTVFLVAGYAPIAVQQAVIRF